MAQNKSILAFHTGNDITEKISRLYLNDRSWFLWTITLRIALDAVLSTVFLLIYFLFLSFPFLTPMWHLFSRTTRARVFCIVITMYADGMVGQSINLGRRWYSSFNLRRINGGGFFWGGNALNQWRPSLVMSACVAGIGYVVLTH